MALESDVGEAEELARKQTEEEEQQQRLVAEELESKNSATESNGETSKSSNKNQYDFGDAMDAIQNNALLQKILKEQPNILKHSDDNGWTILLEATIEGNLDAVTMILDNTDDVAYVNRRFLPDGSGGNALWLAKQTGNEGIVNKLIEHGGVEMALESDVGEAEELARKQTEEEEQQQRLVAEELARNEAEEKQRRIAELLARKQTEDNEKRRVAEAQELARKQAEEQEQQQQQQKRHVAEEL